MASSNDPFTRSGIRQILTDSRWALAIVWKTSPFATGGLVTTTVIRGLMPAALALAIRGLINSATDMMTAAATDFSQLVPWLVLSFVLSLADAISALANRLFSERLKSDVSLAINNKILDHAATLDLPFFEDRSKRELMARVRQDSGHRFSMFFTESQRTVMALCQTVSLTLVLLLIEPTVLAAVVVVAAPFYWFQMGLAHTRFSTEYFRSEKRRWASYFMGRLVSPHSFGEVKLLGLAPLLIERFRRLMEGFRTQDRRLQLRQFLGSSLFSVIATAAFYGIFARVGYRVLEGALSIGDLAIFGAAAARLRAVLESGIHAFASTREQALYISVVRQFLDARASVVSTLASGSRRRPREVVIKDLTFTYPGTDKPALTNLSLRIAAGETVAIVGENGAGKSTLVKLLVRLYDADSGTIRFDGQSITDFAIEDLHGRIAYLGQSFGRYEASVAENIAYGDWRHLLDDMERIRQLVDLAGVAPMVAEMPQGLDTHIGREFGEYDLSGGQWQRIAIARTLAHPSSILILDEPTSNLDAKAENDLYRTLCHVARNKTTILISHRFSTLAMADRIVVMHEGSVVESGTHDELLANDRYYATLYRLHNHSRVPLT